MSVVLCKTNCIGKNAHKTCWSLELPVSNILKTWLMVTFTKLLQTSFRKKKTNKKTKINICICSVKTSNLCNKKNEKHLHGVYGRV